MNKLRIAAENDTVSYIWENSDETLKASGSISRAIEKLEYLLELLYPFYIFTSCLLENTGPTVYRVYDIYNDLFDYLDLAINCLRNKRASWKQQILEGLEEAYKKLRKYYRRTY
ncbi:predicted protein [Aspergillus terreus NIH2624]|uniref:Uncharacterized protein n=1 Tax=Aspergillus terreus (strain NIH 2624 / FGSC A1156) TaxID=341663 RepID=Q0CCU4_ASPTN|nr:uncharacterized protein ATEG_08490 [Aspergillus terreus NIH2624]EAU30622.1 predicted protein [Aspergillus terreus NIH2624]